MAGSINTLFLFVFVFINFSTCMCLNSSHPNHTHGEKRILQMLEEHMTPPYVHTGTPTEIKCYVHIEQLGSIKTISMDYRVQILLRLEWVDERMSFRWSNMPEGLAGKSYINVGSRFIHDVWVPEIFFVNEKLSGRQTNSVVNKALRIYPNGRVMYYTRVGILLRCAMDLRYYPNDKQTCYIDISSFGLTTSEMIVRWDADHPVDIDPLVRLPHFEVAGLVSRNGVKQSLMGNYSYVKVGIKLKRVFGAYWIRSYIPSLLIVIFSWASFWINKDSVPARVSIAGATALAITTQAIGLWSKQPQVSYIKAIDVWMIVCIAFVYGAMLEYAVVNMLTMRKAKRAKAPVKEEAMLMTTVTSEEKTEKHQRTHLSRQTTIFEKPTAVDEICRYAFPVLYCVFLAIYFSLLFH